MLNKLSSLCIIAGLLISGTNANAAYYYYRAQYVPDYEFVTVTCREPHYRYVPTHHYRCGSKHHKYHSTTSHVKRSHYSITTYYVYSTPFGDTLWIPSPCSDCSGAWVNVREYHRTLPYYETCNGGCQSDVDFDMDMRTADDVRDW